MATITRIKLPSGNVVWQLTHGRNPNRIRINVGTTKEQANIALEEFNRNLRDHGSGPQGTSLGETADFFVAHIETNRRPATLARYRRVVVTFVTCFMQRFHPDVKRARDVRASHLEDYKSRRMAGEIQPEEQSDADRDREQELRLDVARGVPGSERGKCGWLGRRPISVRISDRTMNFEMRVLTTWFRWCIRKNHAFMNPVTSVEKIRVPKRTLPRFMTREQLKAFFDACDDRDMRVYGFAVYTGSRKGEIEHLEWADISFEMGVIFVRAKPDVGWMPKTEERLIPISPVVESILRDQWNARTSARWVFATENGNIDTHLLDRLKKICKRAGIKPAAATVHSLRHSFATHLRLAGVGLADIGEALGHQDLATTQIYARVVNEHLRAQVSKLAGQLRLDRVAPACGAELGEGRKRTKIGEEGSEQRKALTSGDGRS